ncbi:hypothetical protein PG993_013699 [Apiospora rasikravindrae]|uniref:DUF7918 domain-containing protein n=1 Tax=Apiospora rasikravindrae TaxID=990691 RepID=A0ABR1RT04_9PEZI
MAILDSVPAIKVTVYVAGELAVEYENPGLAKERQREENLDPLRRDSCYIEAHDDAEFVIRLEIRKAYDWASIGHHLSFGIFVNGKRTGAWVLSQTNDNLDVTGWPYEENGTGATKLQRFKFARITTAPCFELVEDTDEDRVKREEDIVKEMGTIGVRVERVGPFQSPNWPTPSPSSQPLLEVTEKALKGKYISHSTSYGPAENFDARQVHYPMIQQDKGPIAMYRFHYRSRLETTKEWEPLNHELSAVERYLDAKSEEDEKTMGHIPREGVAAVGSADLSIDLADDE